VPILNGAFVDAVPHDTVSSDLSITVYDDEGSFTSLGNGTYLVDLLGDALFVDVGDLSKDFIDVSFSLLAGDCVVSDLGVDDLDLNLSDAFDIDKRLSLFGMDDSLDSEDGTILVFVFSTPPDGDDFIRIDIDEVESKSWLYLGDRVGTMAFYNFVSAVLAVSACTSLFLVYVHDRKPIEQHKALGVV